MFGVLSGTTRLSETAVATFGAVIMATGIAHIGFKKRSVVATMNRFPFLRHEGPEDVYRRKHECYRRRKQLQQVLMLLGRLVISAQMTFCDSRLCSLQTSMATDTVSSESRTFFERPGDRLSFDKEHCAVPRLGTSMARIFEYCRALWTLCRAGCSR